MNDSIIREIEAVVRCVFRAPNLSVTRETTAADVDGWDSMSHLLFIAEIERVFGVRFPDAMLGEIANLGDLSDAIRTLRA